MRSGNFPQLNFKTEEAGALVLAPASDFRSQQKRHKPHCETSSMTTTNMHEAAPPINRRHCEASRATVRRCELLQWAAVVGQDLHPYLREVFLAVVRALNESGYAEGTLTEIARQGGLRRTESIRHRVRSLEFRGLIARRGTRLWAAPLAPPLVTKTEKEARIVGEQRQRILDRDGHKCRACGGTKRLCIDHIVAWSCGGSNEDDNLQVLCGSCNSRKQDRTQEQFEELSRKAGIRLRGDA